jgi:hypothetical protein
LNFLGLLIISSTKPLFFSLGKRRYTSSRATPDSFDKLPTVDYPILKRVKNTFASATLSPKLVRISMSSTFSANTNNHLKESACAFSLDNSINLLKV